MSEELFGTSEELHLAAIENRLQIVLASWVNVDSPIPAAAWVVLREDVPALLAALHEAQARRAELEAQVAALEPDAKLGRAVGDHLVAVLDKRGLLKAEGQ